MIKPNLEELGRALKSDWAVAQDDFDNWPLVGVACDGTPLRSHSEWGDGVYEKESRTVISPIAYSVRQELRARGVRCFGDKP